VLPNVILMVVSAALPWDPQPPSSPSPPPHHSQPHQQGGAQDSAADLGGRRALIVRSTFHSPHRNGLAIDRVYGLPPQWERLLVSTLSSSHLLALCFFSLHRQGDCEMTGRGIAQDNTHNHPAFGSRASCYPRQTIASAPAHT